MYESYLTIQCFCIQSTYYMKHVTTDSYNNKIQMLKLVVSKSEIYYSFSFNMCKFLRNV